MSAPWPASLGIFLHNHSFACTVARTATEARRLLDDTPFDFVLLDLGLPDGDGLDLLAESRQHEPGRGRHHPHRPRSCGRPHRRPGTRRRRLPGQALCLARAAGPHARHHAPTLRAGEAPGELRRI
ncbi:hypothetical protein ACFQT0_07130 [Hymenobacter humi]|uniref:Response regulator n=1 Tax=Hymenobacter humi TaxID=1411620 RepID=A0ABW2U1J9_9BACT